MDSLHILMLITQYAPTVGGAELQAQAVAEALVTRGHRATVLTQRVTGQPVETALNGVRLLRRLNPIALGPLWGASLLWQTTRELNRLAPVVASGGGESDRPGDRVDVIHCHQIDLLAAAAGRRRRRRGGPPVIATGLLAGDHGDVARLAARRGGGAMMREAREGLDRAISICEPMDREFLEHGFVPERIARIPCFVDERRFFPADSDSPGEDWLFAGRLHHDKGLDLLLRAMAVEHGAAARITLAVVGEGAERAAWERLAGELGLGGRVRFIGRVDAMREAYVNARGLIMPSRAEGLPNVALEALACGVPLIAADAGGLREILEGADVAPGAVPPPPGGCLWLPHGILVQIGDVEGLRAALDAAETRRARIEACGRSGVSMIRARYGRDAVLDKLFHLYENLTREHSNDV